jgi:hypothetical protein
MTSDAVHFQSPSLVGQDSWPDRRATAGDGNASILNPYLIALGIIYVVWSWVHLPSSIWVRSLFACYLIWRMKPDIIIPFVLSCVQLRIELGGDGSFEGVHDLAQQMTGFEQYAFIIPCMLYVIRTFVAACSVRVARRSQFPFWLYNLYLFGMLFVVFATVSAYGSRGWTGAIREYCVVGLYFYGLLMPACSKRQLMQLAKGFAVLGMLTMLAGIAIRYNNRQLWVLMPIAGSFAPLLILGGGRVLTCLWAAFYSLVGFAFATKATFTLLLLWIWNTIAGISLGLFGRNSLRRPIVTGLTYALITVTLGILFYAALWHDPTRDVFEAVRGGQGSTFDRMRFKLLSDRGPIWWGAMRALAENPTLCGTPAPEFVIRSLGKEQIWPYSTHSILLDPLLRQGLVAGPILILVLAHTVLIARNAIVREADVAVAVLGLAVISNNVLGGATLPYMLHERSAEAMHMVAGLLAVYGFRRGMGQKHVPRATSHVIQHPAGLPAA